MINLKDDCEIIKGMRERDEDYFRFFVDKYGGLIKSIVLCHLKNYPDEVDECVNDTLLGVWSNISRFDESKNNFKNWVGAVAKYKTIDRLRKSYAEVKADELMETIADKSSFKETELKELVEELLSGLDPDDRELFIRKYIYDEDIAEIAFRAGKTKEYIYNRLSRKRKQLRKQFKGGDYFEK